MSKTTREWTDDETDSGILQERIAILTTENGELRRLAAEAGEWVDAMEDYWGYFNIERNGRVITVFVDEDAPLDNGYLLVPLPDTVRLQLRRVVASEATVGSVFSSVASSLAITMLQQTLDEGKSISIPSLGIVIEPNKVDTSEATGGDKDEANT